jgi:hypothetical protein
MQAQHFSQSCDGLMSPSEEAMCNLFMAGILLRRKHPAEAQRCALQVW